MRRRRAGGPISGLSLNPHGGLREGSAATTRKFWKGRTVTILTPHKPIRPHPHQCRTVLRTGLEGEARAPPPHRSQTPGLVSSGNWRLRRGRPNTKTAPALLSLLRNSYAIEPRRTLFFGNDNEDLRMYAV
jgi:hypothetical protein